MKKEGAIDWFRGKCLHKEKVLVLLGAVSLCLSGWVFVQHTSSMSVGHRERLNRPVFSKNIVHINNKIIFHNAYNSETPRERRIDVQQGVDTGVNNIQSSGLHRVSTVLASAPVNLSETGQAPGGLQQGYRQSLSNQTALSLPRNTTESTTPNRIDFVINPQCSNYISSTYLQVAQWNSARLELGLPKHAILSDSTKASVVRRFFSITYGVVTISVKGRPMSYTMIWKSANDAIRKNMMAEEKKRPIANPLNAPSKVIDRKESHSAASYKAKLMSQFGLSVIPPSFTFAREPISHFISGLSEYYWRNFPKSNVTVDILKRKLGGMLDFKELNERNDEVKQRASKYILWHFFAMSGILRPKYNVSYLGRLESFDDDWELINAKYESDIKINKSIGFHESSNDPNQVKASFKRLFREDIRYKRALCQLLYADYVCFSYELPAECKNITITPPPAPRSSKKPSALPVASPRKPNQRSKTIKEQVYKRLRVRGA